MKQVKPPQLDIVSTIALAHADNWTRHWSATPFVPDATQNALAEASDHRGFARSIIARLQSWRGAINRSIVPARVRQA